MTLPTLSIVVPTYNRAPLLQYLLVSISDDFDPWPDDLELVVIDNASTDGTAEVVRRAADEGTPIRSIRNVVNIGMDANLAGCFAAVSGKYLWQIGDDEILYKGAASFVLNVCRARDFGLMHLESEGFDDGAQESVRARRVPAAIACNVMTSREMIRAANLYLTFISANIINRSIILDRQPDFDSRSESNTQLPQLAWICAVLRVCDSHIHITSTMLGALSGNTGGYKLLEVFCINFPNIVARQLGRGFPPAKRIASNAALLRLVPAQVMAQGGAVGPSRFGHEETDGVLRHVYSANAYFTLLVRPMISGHRWKRGLFFLFVRAFNRLNRMCRYRLL